MTHRDLDLVLARALEEATQLARGEKQADESPTPMARTGTVKRAEQVRRTAMVEIVSDAPARNDATNSHVHHRLQSILDGMSGDAARRAGAQS